MVNFLTGLFTKSPLKRHFNFSAPVVQSFPTTAVSLASLLGDPAATPSHIFPLQETSGSYADTVGAGALVAASGLQGQTAPVWDGSSYTSRASYESTAVSNRAQNTGDTTLFDQTTGSFAILGVYRCNIGASNGPIVGKRNATAGFSVEPNGATGLRFSFDDTVITPQVLETEGSSKDGALRAFAAVVNRTTDLAWIITEQGATSLDISTLGSLTNTGPFAIGQQDGYLAGAGECQTAYLALFEGAAAEALDQTAFDNFWLHGSDPTGLLTTQSRASLISVPVAPGYVGHFSDNTLPIGYHPSFTDADKLGLYCNSAVTNLVTYSEDISQAAYTKTSCTVVGNSIDSPDGFRSADKITQTGAGGRVFDSAVVVAETEYTLSFWARTDDGGHNFDIGLSDHAEATFIATNTAAATDSWQRFTLTGTTDAGQTNSAFVIYGGITADSDKVLYVWGLQLVLGSGAGAYIRTSGATASLVFSDYRATAAAGELMKAASGEVEITYVIDGGVGNTSNYIFCATDTAKSAINRHQLSVVLDIKPTSYAYDSSGVAYVAAFNDGNRATAGAENTTVLQWDSEGGLTAATGADYAISTAGFTKTDIGTFTATETITDIFIGNYLSPSSVLAADGLIQHIKIWDVEVSV